MSYQLPIQENKKTNDTGEETVYRNVDLRDIPKGESVTFKNMGEPQIIDSQYGPRYMFRMILPDNTEVTSFVNQNMKVSGPGVPFGKKLHELMTEKTGDITITRLKSSSRGKLQGTDKFDLWSLKSSAETPEQQGATSAPNQDSLVLTEEEQKLVNQQDLFTKPFEQIKDLFDAYGIPEARALQIYEEFKK